MRYNSSTGHYTVYGFKMVSVSHTKENTSKRSKQYVHESRLRCQRAPGLPVI